MKPFAFTLYTGACLLCKSRSITQHQHWTYLEYIPHTLIFPNHAVGRDFQVYSVDLTDQHRSDLLMAKTYDCISNLCIEKSGQTTVKSIIAQIIGNCGTVVKRATASESN